MTIPQTTPLPYDPVHDGTGLEVLTQFLDYYRSVLRRKVEGLEAEDLQRSIPPSTMTLSGLLHHLDYVEDEWLGVRTAGEPPAPPWDRAPWDEDNDWDWHRADELTPEELLAGFDARVERSRLIQHRWTDLDAVIAQPGERGTTYRYVLVHLIEEYARHAGHADLLRETVDGTVGD